MTFPYASLENRILHMEEGQGLERLVPRRLAERYEVLPLFRTAGLLAVATPHCADPDLLRHLAEVTGLGLTPFAAERGEVLLAIAAAYR